MTTLTVFGKFCRNLRIDNNERLQDMAARLEVSPAFLSSVETGRRKPPKGWDDKIISLYRLPEEKAEKLREVIYFVQNDPILDMSNMKEEDRKLLRAMARKIPFMSEKEKRLIFPHREEISTN